MNHTFYFDYAAATPLDPDVLQAMTPYFSGSFYNPSAQYLAAKAVHQDMETARATVAGLLGVRSPEIIFTAGGTEANNLAIQGVAHRFPNSHIVTTALEHDSVLIPVRELQKKGWLIGEVVPKEDGTMDPHSILGAVTDQTVLVSIMSANNEIGTVQPIKEVATGIKALREARRASGNDLPLYLHTDACQAANYLDLHVHRLGVDLMTINGGKIYGPKQTGILVALTGVKLDPLIFGGGQEFNRRSGTENVPAIIGFAEALRLAVDMRKSETERLRKLQDTFLTLLAEKLPYARINGSVKRRLPNNVHITLPGRDNERLLYALDEAGIQAAAGSACSASKEESSHVLKAIGLSDDEAHASLRFSMGRGTTEQAIHKVIEVLAKRA